MYKQRNKLIRSVVTLQSLVSTQSKVQFHVKLGLGLGRAGYKEKCNMVSYFLNTI